MKEYVTPKTRLIKWTVDEPGSKIGEPYVYGPTLEDYRKNMKLSNWGGKPQEYNWLKAKK